MHGQDGWLCFDGTSGGAVFGADDFLPCLTWVLLRSDLLTVQLDTDYMMELLDPTQLQGEGGYYLTSMYASLYYISSFRPRLAARQLSVEAQISLDRWHRRRTLHCNQSRRSKHRRTLRRLKDSSATEGKQKSEELNDSNVEVVAAVAPSGGGEEESEQVDDDGGDDAEAQEPASDHKAEGPSEPPIGVPLPWQWNVQFGEDRDGDGKLGGGSSGEEQGFLAEKEEEEEEEDSREEKGVEDGQSHVPVRSSVQHHDVLWANQNESLRTKTL
ncbi:hypothetical protein CRUP_025446 [Coryphaenoides rupestris]|nr:hypothetical protein CRUP_025446 [Coryphaenoides rupestris]